MLLQVFPLPARLVLLCIALSCLVCSNRSPAAELQALLVQHCGDCHSGDDPQAGIRLDQIALLSAAQAETLLSRAEEQVALRLMPPSDGVQLSQPEHDDLLQRISAEFAKRQLKSAFQQKLLSPSYGNYVSHSQLFDGSVTEPAWSPARLWRTSPHVFDNLATRFAADTTQLRQPFVVDDRQGIRDYSAMLFADSAVVSVLMSNAGAAADQLLEKRQPWQGLAAAGQTPADDALRAALLIHFENVVVRAPAEQELQKYIELFGSTLQAADHREALRIVLMAVLLHPESVYRLEIGLGQTDQHGRRMLSTTEMAFAVAYALTDRPPDAELLQAAAAGSLQDRSALAHQVRRMLNDPDIGKPRILRFFQEFFGYTQAHKVFKDAERSGGFSYYGENYPLMYERDADFFVLNILEDDVDVFRRLLLSDEYYILNRQTFRNTIYDFYNANREMIDADEFPPEKQLELLQRLDLRGWHELNQKYYLHNFNRGFRGTAAAIRQIVKEVRQWKNTDDEYKLLHGMQPLYRRYPMVYDLEDDEQDFLLPQPYRRPNRAGILTHPAWLIAHSLNDTTDPIRRGKWIQERLLAGTVPDLPITVDATIPEDHSRTLRERLQVTEQQECWKCHQKMNPLGYPFEIFDDFGRYRTQEVLDKLPLVAGQLQVLPIMSDSHVADSGDPVVDGDVDDALQLISRLAESDRVRQSIIRHVFRYFLGRNESLRDSSTLISADQAYLNSNGSFRELLVSLLTSDSFLYRR